MERLKSELGNERTLSEEKLKHNKEVHILLHDANALLDEAKEAEKELQAKCQSAEDLSSKLVYGLDVVRSEFKEKESKFSEQLKELKGAVDARDRNLQEQTEKVAALEEALEAEIKQADEAIQQWQDS